MIPGRVLMKMVYFLLPFFLSIFPGMTRSQGFIPNSGQVRDESGNPVPEVKYLLHAPGGLILFRESGLSFVFTELSGASPEIRFCVPEPESRIFRLDLDWIGNSLPDIEPGIPAAEFLNYYVGNFSAENIPVYRELRFRDLYPGIDIRFSLRKDGSLEYDYEAAAGNDLSAIRWKYSTGGKGILFNDSVVTIETPIGILEEKIPRHFAAVSDARGNQSGVRFVNYSGDQFGLELQGPVPKSKFRVDPWCTFVGSADNDESYGIDYDYVEFYYAAGWTSSATFPLTAGVIQTVAAGALDGWVIKLDTTGNRIWSTYYGGNGNDQIYRVNVLAGGDPVIAGFSSSANLLVSSSGVFQSSPAGQTDAFLVRLTKSGTFDWGTYFGGSGSEVLLDQKMDKKGFIYFCGFSTGANLPVTPGAFQDSLSGPTDAFIAKFDSTGNQVWTTYLGGNQNEDAHVVCLDGQGNILVGGDSYSADFPVNGNIWQNSNAGLLDSYLFKFDSIGNPVFGTYLGGSQIDDITGITVNSNDDIFAIGYTSSSNFPVTGTPFSVPQGGTDIALSRFSAGGNLIWSGNYGGSGDDFGYWIGCDGIHLYAAGVTRSSNFPVLGQPVQAVFGGFEDIFYSRFDSNGNISNATYLGGTGSENAQNGIVGPQNALTITGSTGDSSFPVTTGTFQTSYNGSGDAYVYQFDMNAGCLAIAAYQFNISGDTAFFINNSASSGKVSFFWDFGDGSTDTVLNPSHKYAGISSWLVCLTVATICDTDSVCQTVNLCPLPSSGWTWTASGLLVNFSDTSTGSGSLSHTWDFGDGNISFLQNPSHIYSIPGTYYVCLFVTDTCGTDSLCDQVAVDTLQGIISGTGAEMIRIFPNPAGEYLHLELLSGGNPPVAEIFNSLGQLIVRFTWNECDKMKILETKDWESGLYIMKFRFGSREISRKVVVR